MNDDKTFHLQIAVPLKEHEYRFLADALDGAYEKNSAGEMAYVRLMLADLVRKHMEGFSVQTAGPKPARPKPTEPKGV